MTEDLTGYKAGQFQEVLGRQIKNYPERDSFSFWWARRDLNPQGFLDQRILSPPRIPIPPLARDHADYNNE